MVGNSCYKPSHAAEGANRDKDRGAHSEQMLVCFFAFHPAAFAVDDEPILTHIRKRPTDGKLDTSISKAGGSSMAGLDQ